MVLLPALRQLVGSQHEQRLEGRGGEEGRRGGGEEREEGKREERGDGGTHCDQSLSCVQTFGDAECSSCNDSAQVLRLHSNLQM